ncbi:MAG TPA: hypothetical protein VHT29_08365 [Solirubrobacteraceae bacterium]|nr:hypothetical protein [Solirubrobacteraceae bacterium]
MSLERPRVRLRQAVLVAPALALLPAECGWSGRSICQTSPVRICTQRTCAARSSRSTVPSPTAPGAGAGSSGQGGSGALVRERSRIALELPEALPSGDETLELCGVRLRRVVAA